MRRMAAKEIKLTKPDGDTSGNPRFEGGPPTPDAIKNLQDMADTYIRRGSTVPSYITKVLESNENTEDPSEEIAELVAGSSISSMAKDRDWIQLRGGDDFGKWVRRPGSKEPVADTPDTTPTPQSDTLPKAVPQVVIKPSALDKYIAKNEKVSYIFDVGTFKTDVCDVIVTEHAVYVVNKTGTSAFIPAPCTEFLLKHGSNQYKCTYPSALAPLKELGIEVMVLLRQD